MAVLSRELGAFLLVLGAGMSTCLGAAIVFSESCVKLTSKVVLASGLGVSAGVMMYVSFVEIMVKSFAAFEEDGMSEADAKLYGTLCFFSGFVIMYFLDWVVHQLDPDGGHCVSGGDIVNLGELLDRMSGEVGGERLRPPLPLQEMAGQGKQEQEQAVAGGDERSGDGQTSWIWSFFSQGNGQQGRRGAEVEVLVGTVPAVPVPQADVRQLDVEAGNGTPADSEGEPGSEMAPERDLKLERMGLLTALAIGIHNLPEGLATYVAAVDDPAVGAALAVAIALHNIPEGICVSVPIYFATGDRQKAFFWAFISGFAEIVGAGLGWAILSHYFSHLLYGVIFGIVSGMMVYIVLYQLLPTAHRYDPDDKVTSTSTVAGMAVMAMSLILFLY
jgi:ZIP family zinc transporter